MCKERERNSYMSKFTSLSGLHFLYFNVSFAIILFNKKTIEFRNLISEGGYTSLSSMVKSGTGGDKKKNEKPGKYK